MELQRFPLKQYLKENQNIGISYPHAYKIARRKKIGVIEKHVLMVTGKELEMILDIKHKNKTHYAGIYYPVVGGEPIVIDGTGKRAIMIQVRELAYVAATHDNPVNWRVMQGKKCIACGYIACSATGKKRRHTDKSKLHTPKRIKK